MQGLHQAAAIRVGPIELEDIVRAVTALRVNLNDTCRDGSRNPAVSDPGHSVLAAQTSRRTTMEPRDPRFPPLSEVVCSQRMRTLHGGDPDADNVRNVA